MMPSTDINSIVLNIHGVDYHCIVDGIIKIEALNVLRNTDLSERNGSL